MPLSTVCTVSSRPRAWSSYTNIRAKDVKGLTSMNSAEEISKYKESADSYYSPTLSRRLLGYGYDFPEKSPKKDKKWSIGSFFRRKKKEDSESSSEEDSQKKGFLGRKKRKSDKKKKGSKQVGTFDHVVLSRNSHLYSNGFNGHDEAAIFSDPSGGFNNFNGYANRALPKTQTQEIKKSIKNTDDVDNFRNNVVSGSSDNVTKKNRKGLTKVRAEARRINLKHDTSSDEDSQRSASSSRFRSDDSLGTHKDGSLHRRSRAARTERYLKRHSKDGENPKDYIRLSKSDVENSMLHWKTSDDSNRSPTRSPLVPATKAKSKTSFSSLPQSPSISGLSTIPPPSHGSYNKIKVSNSTSNPSYKPPLSMNEYNFSTRKLQNDYFDNQRSLSCDANIHKSPSMDIESEIIHVQFPLGKPNNRYRNLSLIDSRFVNAAHSRQPPPPPPRDPKRLVTAQYYDNARPNTYYFDNIGQNKSKSFNFNTLVNHPQQTRKINSFNLHPSCRSTSEDHLPKNSIQLIPRPSSATPDATLSQKYVVQRHPELKSNPENFNYLADKKPRSRRPIFIKPSEPKADRSGTQKIIDFWKQKDKEGSNNFQNILKKKPESRSPQMFTCQTHVQTQVFLPSVLQNDITTDNLANSTDSLIGNDNQRTVSPFKPIPSDEKSQPAVTIDLINEEKEEKDDEMKRKSSNLEEALDELEAIYNSLRLGDEDLLERAEQREKDAAAEKLKMKREVFPSWSMSRGALSDSSFSYEPFDSVDSPRRKRFIRKSQTIDRKGDDMAFRKLNKERSSTINDPQSMIAKVSYLEASPVYGKDTANNDSTISNKNTREPDVTLDDVVYRNVKFANNIPKVVEQQPPFGIPLGPITPAANSDYLHAVPDNIHRPTFKPRKIPDLVKDDLAFRNLRKDQNKEPALPPVSSDDLKNNNTCETKLDLNSLKKKRAVRSLSANIGSLINKDILTRGVEKYKYNNNSENQSKTLTDIADAMEIARQVLREKENKISSTRKAFLSDTDTNNGNSDNLAESRMNFLNSLKTPVLQHELNLPQASDYLHTKPLRGLTPERKSPKSPRESTPVPVSPFEEKLTKKSESRDSSLDELLTALATEARETNERITNELKNFSEQSHSPQQVDENLNKPEISKTLSDIDAVSEQAKLCEKLLEGVVDSNDLMASTKSPVAEEVEQIDIEPVLVESVANIVLSRDDSKIDKQPDRVCDSDHDYENLISDEELTLHEIISDNETKCTTPFEEHKAELIASFQELKKNVDLDDVVGPLDNKEPIENEIINESSQCIEPSKDDDKTNDAITGEECVGVLNGEVSHVKECAYVESSNQKIYVSNCDLTINCSTNSICQSDTEGSSGFCSNSSLNNELATSLASLDNFGQTNNLDSLESLKSPKLVLETSKLSKCDGNKQILENQSMIYRDSFSNYPGTSSEMDYREMNSARNRNSNEPGHILDDEKPTLAWYRDPTTVAVACSYGFACAHQLASLDFVAILGVLFAVLSFIAALILKF